MLYLLDPQSTNYLQVALAPCGAHLVALKNETHELVDLLDIDYTASIFEGIWTGEALVQSAYLPSNFSMFNAFYIPDSKQENQIIETVFPPLFSYQYFPYLDSFGDVPDGLGLAKSELSAEWKGALAGKLILHMKKTPEGIDIDNPINLAFSKDTKSNKTLIAFNQNLVGPTFNAESNFKSVLFFENGKDMILRLDLTSEACSATAAFLWGPEGSWGTEVHSLNPSNDTYLGGAYSSNITEHKWTVEATIPWIFLPPNMTNIQGVEYINDSLPVRILFPAHSSSFEDLMNSSHPFDTTLLVDDDFIRNESPIWQTVTFHTILYIALAISGVAGFAGVTGRLYYRLQTYGNNSSCCCCESCESEVDVST